MDSSRLLIQEDTKGKIQCKNLSKYDILQFVVQLVFYITDCISDWLFCLELKFAKKGLVFGDPGNDVTLALLIFCIIGTVTVILQVINLCGETFKKHKLVDSAILSAVIIWLEDIPQTCITLYLVVCRGEPTSVFLLFKVYFMMVGIILVFIVQSAKCCGPIRHLNFLTCHLIGLVVMHGLVLTIFITLQMRCDDSGSVKYKKPSFLDNKNYQQYFTNVSIFFSHTHYLNVDMHDLDKSTVVANWLRLTTFDRLITSPKKQLTFNIQIEQDTTGELKMAIWEKKVVANVYWMLVACYKVDSQKAGIQIVNTTNCTADGYFNDPFEIFLKFRFEEPGSFFKRKVLGDIYVNMKLNQSGQCRPFSDYRSTIEDCIRDNVNMTLHYYRTNKLLALTDTNYIKQNGTESVSFFRNIESDMTDVKKAWANGLGQCMNIGHVAPVLDSFMELECSMNVT